MAAAGIPQTMVDISSAATTTSEPIASGRWFSSRKAMFAFLWPGNSSRSWLLPASSVVTKQAVVPHEIRRGVLLMRSVSCKSAGLIRSRTSSAISSAPWSEIISWASTLRDVTPFWYCPSMLKGAKPARASGRSAVSVTRRFPDQRPRRVLHPARSVLFLHWRQSCRGLSLRVRVTPQEIGSFLPWPRDRTDPE